jgi:hypothetical protein
MSVSQNISNCKASRVANISAAEFDAAITIPCGSHCGFPQYQSCALGARALRAGIRAGELLAGATG